MACLSLFLAFFPVFLSSPILMEQVDAVVSCDAVIQQLSPCVSYIGRDASAPSKMCCQGAKYVFKHFGRAQRDRQGVCNCLVSLMPYLDGPVNGTLVSDLPGQCGINFKLPPVGNNFDCSQYASPSPSFCLFSS